MKESNDKHKEMCMKKDKEELCKKIRSLEERLTNMEIEKEKECLDKYGSNISETNDLKAEINILKEELATNELKEKQKELKLNKDKLKEDENARYICDIEKSDLYINKLEQSSKEQNYNLKKPGLGGGRSKSFNQELKSLINGGIIPRLKNKYSKMLKKEYKKFNAMKGGKQVGGMNPTLIMGISVVKIFFFTIGTFIFDWWPIVVLISIYCAYLEYSMLKITDTEIMGLEGLSLLFAFLCPCCWTAFRLFKGWKTPLNTETDNLWNIMQNCSPKFSMPLTKVQSSACEGTSCYVIPPQCYKSIFETGKEYDGFSFGFGSGDDSSDGQGWGFGGDS